MSAMCRGSSSRARLHGLSGKHFLASALCVFGRELIVRDRYSIGGKLHTQEARVSPFSIIQQQPGEFAVTSIAHQQKMCKTAVTDLRYTVHPLPAAQVGHGKRIVQDIHEGACARIRLSRCANGVVVQETKRRSCLRWLASRRSRSRTSGQSSPARRVSRARSWRRTRSRVSPRSSTRSSRLSRVLGQSRSSPIATADTRQRRRVLWRNQDDDVFRRPFCPSALLS